MKKVFCTLLFSLITIFTHNLYSQQPVPDNTTGRLWGLCKVWGYMKYYHPNTCQVNWDSLIRENSTLVAAASDNIQYNTYVMNMLDYLGQISPQQATVSPPADSNLNLQLDWIGQSNFSQPVQDFLDTFKSRAGTNAALICRIKFNDYTFPGYFSYVDFTDDVPNFVPDFTKLKDRLALTFHYWSVFNYFGPYRNLTDIPWDTTLFHAIEDMISATDDQSYMLAILKMQSRINDAHGFFNGPTYNDYFGYGAVGIQFRWYEQKIVVYKIHNSQSGLSIGDELIEMDGIPIADVAASYRDKIAASNEATFYRDLCVLLSRAALNSNKVLRLKNSSGALYTLPVTYNMELSSWYTWKSTAEAGPAWRTACNGYGYVDMGKLEPAECEQMYQELKTKPGIIFDCRNYPKNTMLNISRFLFPEPIISARYFVPDLSAPGLFKIRDDGANMGSWSTPSPYAGQVYFIVDQETQSHAEYTVQYLGQAPGAIVIGTQTAGADGNLSYVMHPRPYSIINPSPDNISFTSLGWYYEDWYQCQRNGIKINTTVSPTIQGLRAGRDEMLEWITGCPTSIKETVKGIEQLEIIPNPAREQLNVRFQSNSSTVINCTVSDMLGSVKLSQQQRAETGKNNWQIPVKDLVPGIYFLKVAASDGSNHTLKFIKE